MTRLDLHEEPVEVLLGGGLLQTANRRLHAAIEEGIHAVAPGAIVRTADSSPIAGAALLGLDELGAGADAQARLRAELGARVEAVQQPGEEAREPAGLNTRLERADG
jgi:hypothetical protein